MSTLSDIGQLFPSLDVKPERLSGDDKNALKCKYVVNSEDDKDFLGDGHFSVVKKCQNVVTKQVYAMKLINKKTIENKLKLVSREINLLKFIADEVRNVEGRLRFGEESETGTFSGHHHILQLFDFFETKSEIVLITQLCAPTDLYEVIIDQGKLDIKSQVKPFTACLLSALSFLHSNNIVHRDIKAENIFFRIHEEEPNPDLAIPYTAHDIIIGDFGLAASVLTKSNNALKEYVGTISYISPEIVKCKDVSMLPPAELEEIEPYGLPVDIWALGVLVYFMAFGFTPFDCDNDGETLECITNANYYIDDDMTNDVDSKAILNFVRKCFVIDQLQRPDAVSLKRHSLVKEYYIDTSSPTKFSSIMEENDNVGFDLNKSRRSSKSSNSSLHSLKFPMKSTSSSSLTYLQFMPSSGSPYSNVSLSPFKTSAKSSSNLNGSRFLDIPPKSSISKKRDTLKKTLSMTSIRKTNSRSTNSYKKSNTKSTFSLDPKPPANSLMNGCYSMDPENFPISTEQDDSLAAFKCVLLQSSTVTDPQPKKAFFELSPDDE